MIDLLGREGASVAPYLPHSALTYCSENTLAALFGVSGVSLSEHSDQSKPLWQYTDTLDLEGEPLPMLWLAPRTEADLCRSGTEIEIVVRPAALHKCPRCWTFTRHEHEDLCKRCTDVVHPQQAS